jgi:hypothetical protein
VELGGLDYYASSSSTEVYIGEGYCQLRKMDSIPGLRGGVLSSIYRPWDPGPRRA